MKGTTAGFKNTFAFDKLIQILIWQILDPKKAIVMGGTYKIPVLMKLLDKNFVADLKADGTFNEAAFEREYKRICTLKILRIAGNSYKFNKLQHKDEIDLGVNV